MPDLYRWFARYHAYRQLYPLWRDLATAFPNIVLDSPRSALADALRVDDLGYRLCRRVIEISDARLELRPYIHPRVEAAALAAADAAGVPSAEVPALVEAATLIAALRQHEHGAAVPGGAGTVRMAPGADDVDGEAAFLCRVAAYYARSPVVQAAIAWLEGEPPPAMVASSAAI